jgi:hypothetical protein
MQDVRRQLRERMRDILAYIRMLQFIEQAGGTVSLQGRSMEALPVGQKTVHVLKAGVFLHLYNLVESTVTTGMEYIAQQITVTNLVFRDLDDCWQKAWATNFAIDEDLGPDRRLTAALRMCQAVADGMVVEIKPKIGVGNLDDRRIEDLAKRYGIPLILRPKVKKAVKHQVFNDLGFLGLVRERRNSLAHGHESFADIGKNYSTADLTRWSWATYQYLKDLLANFEGYVSAQQFRRPPAAPADVVRGS